MITAKYGLWFLLNLDPDGKKDFDIALTDRMEKEFFFFFNFSFCEECEKLQRCDHSDWLTYTGAV